MRRDLKNTLLVPTMLAVASFGPACGNDAPPPTSSTTSAPTETAGAPTSGAPTSTGMSGTSGTTGTGTSTTGGELPDCMQIEDPNTCLSTIECLYLENEKTCIVRCNYFAEQASCERQMYCYWLDGCYLSV